MSKSNIFEYLLPRPCFKMVFYSPFDNLAGRFLVADFSATNDDYTGELLQHPVIENYKVVESPAKVFIYSYSLSI